MKEPLQVEKITQAAAYLVQKRGQGHMSYMKLIKLLYLADRESLFKRGRPITFDKFVSMPYGMVLSGTLNLINGEEPGAYWNDVFEPFGDREIRLKKTSETGKLSKAELAVLDAIFETFGSKSRWELVDYVHTLPEWIDPNGSSIPVEVSDVLKFGSRTPAEIESIKSELESLTTLSSLAAHK